MLMNSSRIILLSTPRREWMLSYIFPTSLWQNVFLCNRINRGNLLHTMEALNCYQINWLQVLLVLLRPHLVFRMSYLWAVCFVNSRCQPTTLAFYVAFQLCNWIIDSGGRVFEMNTRWGRPKGSREYGCVWMRFYWTIYLQFPLKLTGWKAEAEQK